MNGFGNFHMSDWKTKGSDFVKNSVDTIIGAGLVLALILTVALPAIGMSGNYERLQDTISVGLVGFMGKSVVSQQNKE